jgi:hypothetical protein
MHLLFSNAYPWKKLFCQQTVISERFMVLNEAHNFVGLDFLHQLRRLDPMVSLDANCFM